MSGPQVGSVLLGRRAAMAPYKRNVEHEGRFQAFAYLRTCAYNALLGLVGELNAQNLLHTLGVTYG